MRSTLKAGLLGALLFASALRAEYIAFRAVGVVDSATAATQVHCAHFGGGSSTVTVRFRSATGAVGCEISLLVATDNTRSFSTRNTALFDEDSLCTPPGISQGTLEVALADGSSRRVACTAHLLDPGATIAFVEKVKLYNHAWIPLDRVVFENGFEGGNSTDWSATTQ